MKRLATAVAVWSALLCAAWASVASAVGPDPVTERYPDWPHPVTCAYLPFDPIEVFGSPGNAERGSHPSDRALRRFLAHPGWIGPFPKKGWRLVARSRHHAEYTNGFLPSEMFWLLFDRRNGKWEWGGSGGCIPTTLRRGLAAAEWRMDPARQPRPGDRFIWALVTETGCTSAADPTDRIQEPEVIYGEREVRVTFWVTPPKGNFFHCPGNPSARVRVALPGPVGDREIRDGGVYPPRKRFPIETRCSFDPAGGILSVSSGVGPALGTPIVAREGERITVTQFKRRRRGRPSPVECAGGDPTITNTERLDLLVEGSDLLIDLTGGSLTPGRTSEPDGTSEIEIAASTEGRGQLRVQAGPGSDRVVFGSLGRATVGNLNAAQEQHRDTDLTFRGPPFRSFALFAGPGRDLFSGRGGPGTGAPAATALRTGFSAYGEGGRDVMFSGLARGFLANRLEGGLGADRLIGGSERDWLTGGLGRNTLIGLAGDDRISSMKGSDRIFAGSGNDVVFARERGIFKYIDRVDCGTGPKDYVSYDRRDSHRRCERSGR